MDLSSSWFAPTVSGTATLLGAVVVLVGVLKSIRSNEQERRRDREAQETRDLDQRRHDDERAALAIRQALRESDLERVHALVEPVMMSTIAARQGLERDDGSLAVGDVDSLVNTVIPKLMLEREADRFVEAIFALRHAALSFKSALQTQEQVLEQGPPQAAARFGETLERRRDELLAAIDRAQNACREFIDPYKRPVIDD